VGLQFEGKSPCFSLHVLEEENERKDNTEMGQKAGKTEARFVMKKDSYQ